MSTPRDLARRPPGPAAPPARPAPQARRLTAQPGPRRASGPAAPHHLQDLRRELTSNGLSSRQKMTQAGTANAAPPPAGRPLPSNARPHRDRLARNMAPAATPRAPLRPADAPPARRPKAGKTDLLGAPARRPLTRAATALQDHHAPPQRHRLTLALNTAEVPDAPSR